MGIEDYDTLFAARHGRGALDPVPKVIEAEDKVTTKMTSPIVGPELLDSVENHYLYMTMLICSKRSKCDHVQPHLGQM